MILQICLLSLKMIWLYIVKMILKTLPVLKLLIWHSLTQVVLKQFVVKCGFSIICSHSHRMNISKLCISHIIIFKTPVINEGISDAITTNLLNMTHHYFYCKNTVISPNFLAWKFCGKAQFLHSFEQFAQNYAETVPFHKISTPGN